jgi:AAA domain, putative AbiEii toxin, Type IV TA system
MYVRHLRVREVKLLRDVEVDFVGADDAPRMWTVFVGENRLCKTTLLQTIAAAASGVDRGTQLASDVIASWPDLRNPVPLSIEAEFGFSHTRHGHRRYPGHQLAPPGVVPRLSSRLLLEPDKRIFQGESRYSGGYIGATGWGGDPLAEARAQALPGWFVAGYGPSRLLPGAGKAARQSEPTLDRLRPLFGESLIGTGFIELLGEDLGRAFAKVLQAIFVSGGLLPHVTALDLRGRGGIRSAKDLAEAQRFEMDVLDAHGARIRVPATWLSQGYQSVIAWLADLVGQILLEAGEPIESADMEGTVLVDEIDLHLHPTWQVRLIPALKQVFPRLQFIATTHSPMVLPALAAEEVILLSQNAEGSVVATPSMQSPALLTGSELYGAFFEIRKLYPEALGDKLHRYGYLASDPTRTAEEDKLMRALREELLASGVTFDWEPVAREADE